MITPILLNRFRGEDLLLATVEYRAAVLPGRLDAVVFWNTCGAWTFSDMRRFRLEHSFGAGVRVLRRIGALLRLEVARSPRFLVSFSRPF
jgi:hypothetical protein